MRWGPIREAKKLMFPEEIGKSMIHVELNEVGWIHIKQNKGNGGLFGLSPIYASLHLTAEDARNLIKCLQEFVPQSEGEKGPQP